MSLNEYAAQLLEKVRTQKPLVHNITNYVVMNYTANALLACGASPVMAHAYNEVNEMTNIANALVINIGTLENDWVHSMIIASGVASKKNIPVILDPVGAGATALRTHVALKLLRTGNIKVIRGNASEIIALTDHKSQTKGVDALHLVEEAVDVAKQIAQKYMTIVAITGPTDIITDGNAVIKVHNGHKLMSYVTGTGCTATALIGAFCAVDNDYSKTTAAALAYFGVAGQLAAKKTSAPGSFMIALLDELYSMTPLELEKHAQIELCDSNKNEQKN
ncbi:MAG: hydroxyethylthiazole kinase [Spirochaetes bacterium]|nr:hydroxyethylthiazole kinase [Spirochaetota bacterium]